MSVISASSKLTFNAEDHTYWVENKEVPGTTHILRTTGQSKDWSDVPEFYRDRGSAVHAGISLMLNDTLDESSIDDIVRPYLDQFHDWVIDRKGAGFWLSEKAMYSKKLGFAGTVDLIMNQTIYDVKCSKKMDKASEWQYQLQGAAYRTLTKENLQKDFPFKILLLTGAKEPAKEIPLHAPYAAWEYVMGLYNIKTGRIM